MNSESRNLHPAAQRLLDRLQRERAEAASIGYDTSDVSIGIDPFDSGRSLRLVGTDGGYWYSVNITTGKVTRACVGAPSRACEHIALMAENDEPLYGHDDDCAPEGHIAGNVDAVRFQLYG